MSDSLSGRKRPVYDAFDLRDLSSNLEPNGEEGIENISEGIEDINLDGKAKKNRLSVEAILSKYDLGTKDGDSETKRTLALGAAVKDLLKDSPEDLPKLEDEDFREGLILHYLRNEIFDDDVVNGSENITFEERYVGRTNLNVGSCYKLGSTNLGAFVAYFDGKYYFTEGSFNENVLPRGVPFTLVQCERIIGGRRRRRTYRRKKRSKTKRRRTRRRL